MIQRWIGCAALLALTTTGWAADDFELGAGQAASEPIAKVTAALVADVATIRPGEPFLIGVQLTVPKGYYVYYRNTGSSALATKISFAAPAGFKVGQAQFPGPDVKYADIGGVVEPNYIYKKNTVVLAEVVPDKNLKDGPVEFTANVSYQYCQDNGSCFPPQPQKLKRTLHVDSKKAAEPSPSAGAIKSAKRNLPVPADQAKYVKIQPSLDVRELAPGGTANLKVTVEVEPGYKLQMHRPPIADLVSTDLILESAPGLKLFPVPTYPKPSPPKKPQPGFEQVGEYSGTFTITVPVTARDSLKGPQVVLNGLLHYQACNAEGTCYPAAYASFSLPVKVGDAKTVGATAVEETPEAPAAAAATKSLLDSVTPVDAEQADMSLSVYLLYAFIGGLLLNIMPCVLPVIAIKVLGFVQQAGESRRRIFLLNVFYSLGVLSVFWILAGLAVGLNIGWGGLFQRAEFNLVMAGVVFAMVLSLLGVFEIPVPGFAGSMSSSGHQEGLLGAFLTGMLATFLATPCSGPFLGVTLAWSVRQPGATTFLVWTLMGLGMSTPYLLFGMFPQAIRWLPKPGNWMVTFKELAGFVLMGTVVFIIWFLDDVYTIPLLVMLVGLAFGFWMIGNLYDYSTPARKKNVIRLTALTTSALVCSFAIFYVLPWVQNRREFQLAMEKDKWYREVAKSGVAVAAPTTVKHQGDSELPWQPFSEERLEKLLAGGTTVLVDFSASWCLTCKTNEANALNTQATRKLVDEYGVATLYADYSQFSPEIQRWLHKFESISVPLTVVFPGANPTKPIVLRDLYLQGKLLEAIRTAGPSRDAAKQAAMTPPKVNVQ